MASVGKLYKAKNRPATADDYIERMQAWGVQFRYSGVRYNYEKLTDAMEHLGFIEVGIMWLDKKKWKVMEQFEENTNCLVVNADYDPNEFLEPISALSDRVADALYSEIRRHAKDLPHNYEPVETDEGRVLVPDLTADWEIDIPGIGRQLSVEEVRVFLETMDLLDELDEAKDRPDEIKIKPVSFGSIPSKISNILRDNYLQDAHKLYLFEIDDGQYYVIYETDEIGGVYSVADDMMAYKDERGWNPPDIGLDIDEELVDEIYDAVAESWGK